MKISNYYNIILESKSLANVFIDFCQDQLGIKTMPKIALREERNGMKTLADYNPRDKAINVFVGGRMSADFLRSLAHELVHHKQLEEGIDLDGTTGSNTENEANAKAGVLVRNFGERHPQIYEEGIDMRISDFITLNEDLAGKMDMFKARYVALQKKPEDAEARIKKLNELDPTANIAEFTTWLVNIDIKSQPEGLKEEDFGKIKEKLGLFNKFKRLPKGHPARPPINFDINAYKSYPELAQTMEPYGEKEQEIKKDVQRKEAIAGAEVIYEDDVFKMTKVTTTAAAAKLFKGTEWCVKDPSYSKSYLKGGKSPFYMIEKKTIKKKDKRYLLWHNDDFRDFYDSDPSELQKKEAFGLFSKIKALDPIPLYKIKFGSVYVDDSLSNKKFMVADVEGSSNKLVIDKATKAVILEPKLPNNQKKEAKARLLSLGIKKEIVNQILYKDFVIPTDNCWASGYRVFKVGGERWAHMAGTRGTARPLYGYINKDYEIVQEPEYDFARKFYEGLAWVMKIELYDGGNGTQKVKKWKVIDRDFKDVSPYRVLSDVNDFSGGVAEVSIGSKNGKVGKDGKFIKGESPKYTLMDRDEPTGMRLVKKYGKYGFIKYKKDEAGNEIGIPAEVIKPRYERLSLFSKAEDGTTIYPAKFQRVEETSAGERVSKFGYVDSQGKEVLKLKAANFDDFGEFREGLAIMRISKAGEYKYGFIDMKGNWVIKPKFTSAKEDFQNGLAMVGVEVRGEKRYGVIDKTGKWKIEPNFVTIGDFDDFDGKLAVASVMKDFPGKREKKERYGVIDTNGKWIIPPSYREIDDGFQTHAGRKLIRAEKRTANWDTVEYWFTQKGKLVSKRRD